MHKVWYKFETKTMRDYHDLHFKYDVLLSALKLCIISKSLFGRKYSYYKTKTQNYFRPDIYMFFEKGMSNNKHLKFYGTKQ